MKEALYLGSDHAGFDAKEKLKAFLTKRRMAFEDLGAHILDESDDYPQYALKVAEAVSKDKNSKGILLCGSGTGMAIVANKVRGIRAVEASDTKTAKLSREHNDANILTLSGRSLTADKINKIVDLWLKTNFSGEERHRRRINQISEYER